MKTATTLRGLPVLTEAQAAEAGYKSLTTAINSVTEKAILAGVAERRNPERTCFIRLSSMPNLYELAVLSGDVKPTE